MGADDLTLKQKPEPPRNPCRNHPDREASDRCTGCQEAFCDHCLVQMRGQHYCGDCKVMAVEHAPILDEGTIPCESANEALKYAIIGIFCCGIILEPLAISKALEAKRKIAADPTLTGEGKANAALIIAAIALLLWVLGMIGRVTGGGY
jgi:hypothetical protein